MKERNSQSLRVSPEKLDTVKKAWKNHRCNSQEAFAKSLGIGRATFSKFLKGTERIYQENFIQFCEALKLDWQDIAGFPKDAETELNEHQNKQATVETEFATSPTALAPANNALTSEWWSQVCSTMLENQQKQKLTTHLLNGCDKQLKDTSVKLGLVERSEIPRPALDISAEEGSKLYQEKITPISHQEFFEQVIKNGQSQKSKGRRIANIGEPGAGKTTFLQIIAFQVLENYELSVWVDLADLGQNETLEDYILLRWLKETLPIINRLSPQIAPHQVSEELKKALIQEFCQGKVWLLLDGLDEMPAELGNPLTVISKQLKGWLAEARVVLSCRLNVWDADKNALTDFDVYRNLDFSYPNEVREFIQKWFAEKPNKAKGLIGELEQSSKRIQDLIKNPLRLTLLCRTWELMEEKLPDTKAGIYQRLVEAHYKWKDDKQDFKICLYKRTELNKALGELAKEAIDGKNSRFRLRESFVKRFLGEPEQEKSLFWWALKLGWLNPVGLATAEEKDSDEKVYAFFHPTFQEYFAALAIDDWDFFLNHNNENANPFVQYKDKDCVYRIFEPQWKEVILLWLGRCDVELTKKKEEFIEALINFKDDCKGFYWYRAYFLGAAGVGEVRNCCKVDEKVDEIVAQIVYWAVGEFDADQPEWLPFFYPIAEAAKEVMLQTNRPKFITALMGLIGCQDEYISREAALILVKIDPGNRDAIALLKLTGNSQDEYTLTEQASTLGKIDPANQDAIDAFDPANLDDIGALVEKIGPSHHEETRIKAAETLGTIDPGNPDAIQVLLEIIRHSHSWNISFILFQAVSSLIRILTEKHMTEVVSSLKNYLSHEAYEGDYRFINLYQVIWICAQHLPYPEFYKAWHTPTTHHETQKITGTTPLIQSLNQAILPQDIRAGIEPELSQKIHPVFIDISEWIDINNPSLEIYDQMTGQGCPESPQNQPDTLPKLKLYFKSLNKTEKLYFLIFHKSNSEPQEIPQTLLTALSKFGPQIALITDQPLTNLNLKQFSPSQPITPIVGWMREIVMET